MTRIAHLTDLHFGADDPAVVDALVDELNADPPDLVAISGDLTQGARLGEFRAARAFMDRLRAPRLVVPGNHDITPYNLIERFTDPYRRWHAIVGPETEPQWQDGETIVVGLNTARRFGFNVDWSRGRVTHARLRRLLARLDAAPPGLARVVVAHHPLLPPPNSPRTPVAGGARAALAALSAHGVALVMAGHLHRGYARLAAAADAPPLVLQGGTATSVRLRGEPNAYHRVTVSRGGFVHVELRLWNGEAWVTQAARAADARALRFMEHERDGEIVSVAFDGAASP
jgi:3',5'-cyclic AMP phosphodiesterase CpdA